MSGNSLGTLFKITTYGESHGDSIGVIIDGCPAMIDIAESDFIPDMQRRKPGQSELSSSRNEEDAVEILSGVFEGMTTGTPIMLRIANKNQNSKDYSEIKNQYRPGHADFVYQSKYGIRDYRGGGRSSARETAARVAAGVIAKKVCSLYGIEFRTFVKSIGTVDCITNSYSISNMNAIPTQTEIDGSILRIPNKTKSEEAIQYLSEIKKAGDSVGGVIQGLILNPPIGLGFPVFEKLNALLAQSMFSINAVKGFEIGNGIESSKQLGSFYNKELQMYERGNLKFPIDPANHEGGITGGLSNGNIIDFSVYFKPVSSILILRESVDKDFNPIEISVEGRHDPCVVPRAVPIVEAMAALIIADLLLMEFGYRNRQ